MKKQQIIYNRVPFTQQKVFNSLGGGGSIKKGCFGGLIKFCAQAWSKHK